MPSSTIASSAWPAPAGRAGMSGISPSSVSSRWRRRRVVSIEALRATRISHGRISAGGLVRSATASAENVSCVASSASCVVPSTPMETASTTGRWRS